MDMEGLRVGVLRLRARRRWAPAARAGRLRRSVNREAHYAFRKRRVNPKDFACSGSA